MNIIKDKQGITTFWGISIILIEAVVVFFIFYILYFFWIENPTPTSNILIVRAVSRNVVKIPIKVDTADWLTFEDKTNSFEFKSPNSVCCIAVCCDRLNKACRSVTTPCTAFSPVSTHARWISVMKPRPL